MSEPDRERVYARARLGGSLPPGRSPAVVVVDLSLGFTDPELPLGADLTEPVNATRRLLDVARGLRVPIFFTTVAFKPDGSDLGVWRWKSPTMAGLVPGSRGVEIDPRLGLRAEERVLVKQGASAFFGTGLDQRLRALDVDSILICGATTSGCVRATAVDALQYGYLGVVVRECVGDRAAGPHEASLFDMEAKYVDVCSLVEVIRLLEQR